MTDDSPVNLTMLSNFVHQIINPLNGVSGTLDNYLEGDIPEQRREQRLRAARAQIEHASLLLRNLAYFAEMDTPSGAARTGRNDRTCVIPQLVIEAAGFFQEQGLSRDIKIHLEDRDTQYKVTGNPDLLRQVFMNLFDNAVKYGEEGTTVLVRAWAQKRTGALVLEIRGKSPGFEHAEKNKLFDIGYRSAGARSRIASGTGIGLYICRRILREVFSGDIDAHYEKPSSEAVFTIKIPGVWI